MAKIRLQSEWKMWAALGGILLLVIFYLYMASRPPTEGGEYLWNVTKIVDETDLSLRGSGNIIELKLAGLRVPPGQAQAARDFLTKTLENQWVRVKILREGPKGSKEGLRVSVGRGHERANDKARIGRNRQGRKRFRHQTIY